MNSHFRDFNRALIYQKGHMNNVSEDEKCHPQQRERNFVEIVDCRD